MRVSPVLPRSTPDHCTAARFLPRQGRRTTSAAGGDERAHRPRPAPALPRRRRRPRAVFGSSRAGDLWQPVGRRALDARALELLAAGATTRSPTVPCCVKPRSPPAAPARCAPTSAAEDVPAPGAAHGIAARARAPLGGTPWRRGQLPSRRAGREGDEGRPRPEVRLPPVAVAASWRPGGERARPSRAKSLRNRHYDGDGCAALRRSVQRRSNDERRFERGAPCAVVEPTTTMEHPPRSGAGARALVHVGSRCGRRRPSPACVGERPAAPMQRAVAACRTTCLKAPPRDGSCARERLAVPAPASGAPTEAGVPPRWRAMLADLKRAPTAEPPSDAARARTHAERRRALAASDGLDVSGPDVDPSRPAPPWPTRALRAAARQREATDAAAADPLADQDADPCCTRRSASSTHTPHTTRAARASPRRYDPFAAPQGDHGRRQPSAPSSTLARAHRATTGAAGARSTSASVLEKARKIVTKREAAWERQMPRSVHRAATSARDYGTLHRAPRRILSPCGGGGSAAAETPCTTTSDARDIQPRRPRCVLDPADDAGRRSADAEGVPSGPEDGLGFVVARSAGSQRTRAVDARVAPITWHRACGAGRA